MNETHKCGQALEAESGSPGDVTQTKDGAVRMELLVISTFLQIGVIGGFKNIGP